jgi:hypothetical protein
MSFLECLSANGGPVARDAIVVRIASHLSRRLDLLHFRICCKTVMFAINGCGCFWKMHGNFITAVRYGRNAEHIHLCKELIYLERYTQLSWKIEACKDAMWRNAFWKPIIAKQEQQDVSVEEKEESSPPIKRLKF